MGVAGSAVVFLIQLFKFCVCYFEASQQNIKTPIQKGSFPVLGETSHLMLAQMGVCRPSPLSAKNLKLAYSPNPLARKKSENQKMVNPPLPVIIFCCTPVYKKKIKLTFQANI